MFKQAIPVFAEGKEREMNYQLALRAQTDSLLGTVMYLTAFSFYRLTVNGQFVSFGPARTAGGYARVDEISLDEYNIVGNKNEIVIEVAGYYCNSLSTAKQPSFAVAELRRGEEVVLCTGRDFDGYENIRRIQKVERFSIQRHFGEIWDYTVDPFEDGNAVELVPSENRPTYLPRRAPYAAYDMFWADGFVSEGHYKFNENKPYKVNSYSGKTMTPAWGQYYDAVRLPYRWIQRQQLTRNSGKGDFPIRIGAGEYVIVDLGAIQAGFLCLEGMSLEDSDIVVGFSELCSPNNFEYTRMNCQNVIECFYPESTEICAQSFEPYTCRLAMIMVRKGCIELSAFGVRAFEYNTANMIKRDIKDSELAKIYRASEITFAHNAVDLYSDCPSRERAGWLCDSFFTGRSEYFLTGKTLVEDAFLENYRLFKNTGEWPDGILPMCYPSDANTGDPERAYIPQWNLWYILEVKEYLTERNTSVDKELFRDSIYGVLRFFERYENEEGLLQSLPGWNFVEWSTANEWVQDVNYPTNFLYAEVLCAVDALYGDARLSEKAEKIRTLTRERSFDGEVFIDNAVFGEDGKLHNTQNSSEAAQYYAILFGGVDLDSPMYSKLKEHVLSGFSEFDKTGREFVPVNAFIGFYLRILVLMKLEEKDILRKDILSFFGGMVASTGTLWEYKERKGSHDHGFASFAAVAIDFIEKK